MKGQFESIFCRNVMIYFDERHAEPDLAHASPTVLAPGGTSLIGHSERIASDQHPFDLDRADDLSAAEGGRSHEAYACPDRGQLGDDPSDSDRSAVGAIRKSRSSALRLSPQSRAR